MIKSYLVAPGTGAAICARLLKILHKNYVG